MKFSAQSLISRESRWRGFLNGHHLAGRAVESEMRVCVCDLSVSSQLHYYKATQQQPPVATYFQFVFCPPRTLILSLYLLCVRESSSSSNCGVVAPTKLGNCLRIKQRVTCVLLLLLLLLKAVKPCGQLELTDDGGGGWLELDFGGIWS